MELGLDIRALTQRGRKPSAVEAEVVRGLEEADLALLSLSAPPAIELKKLSERHHALARLLASGVKEGEAAAVTGYDPSRVSILKASPAFQELLELYTEKNDIAFADVAERLAGLTKDALLLLHERMEESPEKVTTGQLLEIMKAGADRSGFGPSSKQEVSVTTDLGLRLEAARQRERERRMNEAQPMIDITPQEAAE